MVLHLKKPSLYYITRKDPAGHNVVNKSHDDRNTWSELSVQRAALTRPSTRRWKPGSVESQSKGAALTQWRPGCVESQSKGAGCCTDSVEARMCGVTVQGCCTDSVEARACGVKGEIQSTPPDTRQVEAVSSKLHYAHEPELHCCLATQGILTLSVCTFTGHIEETFKAKIKHEVNIK